MFSKFKFFNATYKAISVIFMMTFFVAACAETTSRSGSGSGSSGAYGSSAASRLSDSSETRYLIENVGDRVFFDTDKARLNGVARATLLSQAQWLKQNGNIRLIIEGHADERGTRDYNIALGARRASAVRDFLISEGISSRRLRTISYGKERPVSLCSEESCWSKNRRAVSTIR